MLLVNLNHTNELFAYAAAIGAEARPPELDEPPPEMIALTDLWGRADMSIFFFCSGIVANEEVTSDSLRVGFVQLLLPCFMVDSWQNFVGNPSSGWFSRQSMLGDHGRPWYVGNGLFQNHFWYLPGLFITRIALSIFGKLPTSHLLLVCVGATFIVRDGERGQAWPLSHTFSFFPIYIAGFLVKRHNLLTQYLSAVRRRPALRLVPAVIALGSVLCVMVMNDTPHRIFFRPFCSAEPNGIWGRSPLALIWVKLWRFVYAYAWTGWLPIDDHGWVTRLGSRTLTNYMLCRMPIILVGKFGQCFLLDGLSSGAFWVLVYLAMPFLTAALCSATMTFALWPLVVPRAWAGPLLGISRGADPGTASPYWPIAFALATVAFNYLETHGPRASAAGGWSRNWWGAVSGAGAPTTPCNGAPFWSRPS